MKSSEKKEICQQLSHLLADTFVLYVKTLHVHWNMVSPQFFMFHTLLQKQYESLQEVIDDLAERIRMLGGRPPHSMHEFLKLACLKESLKLQKDLAMIKELVSDHQQLATHCAHLVSLCQKQGDEGTADQLIGQMRDHDKQAWLLRSHYASD